MRAVPALHATMSSTRNRDRFQASGTASRMAPRAARSWCATPSTRTSRSRGRSPKGVLHMEVGDGDEPRPLGGHQLPGDGRANSGLDVQEVPQRPGGRALAEQLFVILGGRSSTHRSVSIVGQQRRHGGGCRALEEQHDNGGGRHAERGDSEEIRCREPICRVDVVELLEEAAVGFTR